MVNRFKEIVDNSKFLTQVVGSCYYVWSKWLRPVRQAVLWAYHKYKAFWNKATYRDGKFVYSRGAFTVVGTVAFLYAIPMMLVLMYQTTMYAATYHNERVYLFHAQELYPDDNIWSVRGCEMEDCANESLYFRVSPTVFNQIWSVLHKGKAFLSDDIASGVPPGKTECQVISYGIRVKLLMRRFDIYPDALAIVCDGPRLVDQ